jgi:hypothetical protein
MSFPKNRFRPCFDTLESRLVMTANLGTVAMPVSPPTVTMAKVRHPHATGPVTPGSASAGQNPAVSPSLYEFVITKDNDA